MFEEPLPGDAMFRYTGTGTLHDKIIGKKRCGFEAVQFRKATIQLRCVIPALLLSSGFASRMIKVVGKTSNGSRLVFHGPALVTNTRDRFGPGRTRETQLVYTCSGGPAYLRVGRATCNGRTEVRFALTNLTLGGGNNDALALTLGQKSLRLSKLPDYAHRIALVKANSSTDITCELKTFIKNSEALRSLRPLVSKICTLLSFARGTLISSPYFSLVNANGVPSYREHGSAYTRDFVADPVIHPTANVEDTKRFVEKAHKQFLKLDPIYNIQKVVSAYVDGRSAGYSETKGLVLGSLADYLAGIWAERNEGGRVVSAAKFKKLIGSKGGASKLLKDVFPALSSQEIEQMAENMACLNNRSFKSS